MMPALSLASILPAVVIAVVAGIAGIAAIFKGFSKPAGVGGE